MDLRLLAIELPVESFRVLVAFGLLCRPDEHFPPSSDPVDILHSIMDDQQMEDEEKRYILADPNGDGVSDVIDALGCYRTLFFFGCQLMCCIHRIDKLLTLILDGHPIDIRAALL